MTSSAARDSAPWQPVRQAITWAVIAASVLGFLVVAAHSPLGLLANARHDDALFMKLGRHIAEGNWLGPYDAYTLIKGPGYPLFLAVNSWLGTPLTLSEAVFHCAGIAMFFWVFSRLSNRPGLALFGFVLTLWAPAPYLSRVTRDAIYPGGTLALLAAVLYCFYGARSAPARISWAVLAGVLAALFALTREEAIWIAPAVALILGHSLFVALRQRQLASGFAVPALALALAFVGPMAGYYALNKVMYGRATGVEITGTPFKDVLAALQSIDAGTRIPYVPVSRAARMAAYDASPTFRSLKPMLDPADGSAVWQMGCSYYPQTCGDIAGGWFLWALRDAAAHSGHHSSPMRAAAFYGAIASELKRACGTGQLRCTRTLVAMVPHASGQQWKQLPSTLISGVRRSIFLDPVAPPYLELSSGDGDDIEDFARFLGNPARKPAADERQTYRVAGWYYPAEGWLQGRVQSGAGQSTFMIPRIESPDLVTAFKDPQASRQRFDFEVVCPTTCQVALGDESVGMLEIDLGQLVGKTAGFRLGQATLNIDGVTSSSNYARADLRTAASNSARALGARIYSSIMPWLAAAGLIAFLASAIIARSSRRISPVHVMAAAVWTSLAARLLLLGIVDVTSFPAMIGAYLGPCLLLTACAVPLSFGALFAFQDRSGATPSQG